MNDEERTSQAVNHGTVMMAVALAPWYGRVISTSAFNLSMQVLKYLTFTPCGSPLPLSASDGVERSRVYVRVSKTHCYCLRACACVFQLYDLVYVCVRVHVCLLLILRVLRNHSGLVRETRYDTNIVKITCVQTVIALQTIRAAITHF